MTEKGLTSEEVRARLKKFGKNELQDKEQKWYEILVRQFASPFIYLLIFSSLLAIYLNDHLDGMMILVFILINSLLGFYQEFRSSQALKILKKYISPKTKVVRDNQETLIDSIDLVPGDMVILNPGDRIPADLYFVKANDLIVDESILTGESISVNKSTDKNSNLGFSGTVVTAGKGIGVVLKTGNQTALGKISKLTSETKHISNFEKSIARFSSYILRLIIITLILIFFANILIKGYQTDIVKLLIFSIALAVSVIPEALPVVMTFSLSHGALRLARNKVVVKRLSAIEDLGGIELLCSDKTGTLTENNLSVEASYPLDSNLLLYSGLASARPNQEIKKVDSFDSAIWKKMTDQEIKVMPEFKKLAELPFDPQRKRNSLFYQSKSNNLLIVRGAPEKILELSVNLAKEKKAELLNWITHQGLEGKRVLAIAIKKISAKKIDLAKEEDNLEFIGCLSFEDPIKSSAFTAIKQAEKLGVDIRILTGDSKEVATAVALKVGLIKDQTEVITGEELAKQNTAEQHQSIEKCQVFARVNPEEKYKIIQILQEKNEVGFLGEGINDAPALKIANVALVVDSASDIARDTADIVLLHKSLKVIVEGIKLGRETFSNTNKYIKATLSSNFGNFYTVAVASLLVNYLPLLPLQILLINLLTDFPMIAIAGDTVEESDLKNPKSYDIKEIAYLATLLGAVSSFYDFMFFILFSRISPEVLQTNWFIGSILTELAFLFSIRTRKSILKASKPSTIMIFLSIFAAIIALVLPFTTPGHNIFSFITPSAAHLKLIGFLVISYLVSTDFVKVQYYNSSFDLKSHTKLK